MDITLDPNHTFSEKKVRTIIAVNRMNLSHIEGLLFLFILLLDWFEAACVKEGFTFINNPFLAIKSPLSMQCNRSEASLSGKVAPVIMLISLPGLSTLHVVTI